MVVVFLTCSKPNHLVICFLEILFQIYLRYVKDISRSFLDFAIDFNNINKKSDEVDKIKNKVSRNLFLSELKQHKSWSRFLFQGRK